MNCAVTESIFSTFSIFSVFSLFSVFVLVGVLVIWKLVSDSPFIMTEKDKAMMMPRSKKRRPPSRADHNRR